MPGPAPRAIEVTTEEQTQLDQLVARHGTPQQIALRARIVLQAAAGANNQAIARSLEISRDMVKLWRKRWYQGTQRQQPVLERLQDAPRPGGPLTFEAEVVTYLFALACSDPTDYDRPISQWTPRELADELIHQEIVSSISARHVGRLLAEADLKPHQIRY